MEHDLGLETICLLISGTRKRTLATKEDLTKMADAEADPYDFAGEENGMTPNTALLIVWPRKQNLTFTLTLHFMYILSMLPI